eukprot:PhF_6_TR26226/c0_g2_i3/m.37414
MAMTRASPSNSSSVLDSLWRCEKCLLMNHLSESRCHCCAHLRPPTSMLHVECCDACTMTDEEIQKEEVTTVTPPQPLSPKLSLPSSFAGSFAGIFSCSDDDDDDDGGGHQNKKTEEDRDESDYEATMADVQDKDVNYELGRPIVRKVFRSLRQKQLSVFKSLIERTPKLLWSRHRAGETPFIWLFGLGEEWREYGRELAQRDPTLITQRYTGKYMNGENPISLCILNQDFVSLQHLVSLAPEALFTPPKQGPAFREHRLAMIGDRPMFIAVGTNQPNVVSFLVEKGVSLIERNTFGNNVLHHAAFFNCATIIPILVKLIKSVHSLRRAERMLSERNNDGFTPILLAVKLNQVAAFEAMMACQEIRLKNYGFRRVCLFPVEVVDRTWSSANAEKGVMQVAVENDGMDILDTTIMKELLKQRMEWGTAWPIFRQRCYVIALYVVAASGNLILRPGGIVEFVV